MPPELDPEVIASEAFKTAIATAVTEATSPLQDSITNLQSVNSSLKTEKQSEAEKRKATEDKFSGVDLDAYQAMQEKLKEVDNDETRALMAQGEYNKVFEKERASLAADFDTQLKTEVAKTEASNKERDDERELNSNLMRTLVLKVRDDGISQAFVASEADKSQLRSAQAIAKDTVLVDGEYLPVVGVNKDGESSFRHSRTGAVLQNAEGNFGYGDWLKHLAEAEGLPLYAKPNSHSDPGAISASNPKGIRRSKLSEAEKDKLQEELGTEGYLKLPL